MEPSRANIIGTGLIGGSIGLALRGPGLARHRHRRDDGSRGRGAVELGAARRGRPRSRRPRSRSSPSRCSRSPTRPATRSTVTSGVRHRRRQREGRRSLDAVDDPRFVGGHPMAGSEQDGIDGADADVFEGAVWVLTPTARTDDNAFAAVRPPSRRSVPTWSRSRPSVTTRWWRWSRTSRTSRPPR